MENEQVFENDIASRYSEARQPSDPKGGWQEREANVIKEIGASPDDTVASFVWNFDKSYQNNLVSLIRGRKFAEAKSYYDSVCRAVEANRDAIGALTQIGDIGGPTSRELADRANKVFQYDFDKTEVEMTDGSKTTVGEVLADGSPYLADKTRELNSYGFSGRTAGMYMSGSDAQKRVLGGIIDPFVQTATRGKTMVGASVVPNHQQLVDLADDVSTNWDVLEGTFGEDGVQPLIDFVRTSHATSGNASATMRALTEFAANYQDGTMSGSDLARRTITGYKDLLAATMGGDIDKRTGETAPLTDNQRRTFDAIALPAIKELCSRVGKFDLGDPRLKRAMLEVADMNAWASAAGIDVFKDARGNGRDINAEFASYVADAVTETNPSGGNFVSAMRNLRTFLGQTITGGRDAQFIAFKMSGRSSDYIRSVDKATGSRSTASTLDAMARDVQYHIAREIAPYMTGGYRSDDALAYILDDGERRNGFMSRLTGRLMDYFHGEGREQVASVMADAMVRSIREGRKLSFQELAENMLNDPSYPEGDPSRKTLAAWYSGNVAALDLYGPHLVDIENHLKGQGINEARARAIVSKSAERMASLLDKGFNPAVVKDAVTSIGKMYVPRYDDKGELVSIDSVPANLNKTGFMVPTASGKPLQVPAGYRLENPEDWEQIQAQLEQMKPEVDRMRLAREKRAQALADKKEMADYKESLRAARQDDSF